MQTLLPSVRNKSLAASYPPQTIVIAARDEGVRNAIRLLLRVEGYAVTCHSTGADLLVAQDLSPHSLVIVDQHLPDGDGLSFLLELRQTLPGIAAILMVTAPVGVLRSHANRERISLVEKPLVAESLLQAVRDWARRRTLN